MEDKLTVIITTSFVDSHPSTELLDITFASFSHLQELENCRKIIICDGYSETDKKCSIKSGIINQEQSFRYHKYIDNIKAKNYKGVEILVQTKHYGFAKNVERCLHMVTTPFVMIVQHDQIFIRSCNLEKIISSMENSEKVNYVGFSSNSNDNEVSKRLFRKEFRKLFTDLQNEINSFVNLNYENMQYILTDEKLTILLDSNNQISFFRDETSNKNLVTEVILNYMEHMFGVRIMPLVFWYDKTHICKTDYYLNSVFSGDFKIKSFIEDTFGHDQMTKIKQGGLESFNNLGSYVLYDDFLNPIIAHNNGRTFITEKKRNEVINKK